MEKHCEISQEIVPSFHILKTYEFVVTLQSREILNRLRSVLHNSDFRFTSVCTYHISFKIFLTIKSKVLFLCSPIS